MQNKFETLILVTNPGLEILNCVFFNMKYFEI